MNRILFFTLVCNLCFSFISQAQKYTCNQAVSTDLLPTTGEVFIYTSQFFIDKTNGKELPTDLRIEATTFMFGVGVPTTTSVAVGCTGVVGVRLWVKYPNTDWDYCDTYVDVQNNMGAIPKNGNCGGDPAHGYIVNGAVQTTNGKSIFNAFLKGNSNTGASPITTKVNFGVYVFVAKPDSTVQFHLEKDSLPLNGVSAFDLVLMTKHILSTQLITNKYALIAADVNNNGTLTTSDVVELRKLILGIKKNFSNNKSWRFLDEKMREEVVLNRIKHDTVINFTAVKIGDINGNANAASRSLNTHTFQVEDAHLKAGETTTLSLKGCEGFSFTMRYDADNLELINLDENSALLENGLITTAQIGSEFKATFRAKSDVTLSKSIFINSDITKAEAVVNDESYDVALEFQAKNTSFELFQNQPNPFHDATKISFILPIESRAKITISDLTGRIVKVIENDFSKGYNELILNDLQASGILQYTLETPTNRATKKMIKVE